MTWEVPPESATSVDFKDYYEVLGVARNASDEDIKRAFRSMARKHHPDVAKDKANAEDRFKEINEANEVLSDPVRRQKYDELSADWNHRERQSAQPQEGFGGGSGKASEFHFEGTGFSDFFEQFFGSHSRSYGGFGRMQTNGRASAPIAQNGQDIEGDILVTLDEILHGSTRTIGLQRTDPRSGRLTEETLRVKIPPGVRESQLIRLTSKGQEGVGGGAPGNLYLRVKFAKHVDFRVRGTDLYYELELAPWEAILGAIVQIPSLDGKLALKIPAGTVADRQFRLRAKGVPAGDGKRGNLYATVSIQVPSHTTPEERTLWEELSHKSTFNPRKNS